MKLFLTVKSSAVTLPCQCVSILADVVGLIMHFPAKKIFKEVISLQKEENFLDM